MLLPVLATLCVACATSGYKVRIETSEVPSVDPSLREWLSNEAKNHGLSVVREGDTTGPFAGNMSDSYSKVLSDEPHDEISMNVLYTGVQSSRARIMIEIFNPVRGMEDRIKKEIDSVADDCVAELSRWFGASNVTAKRGRVGLPIVR
jgi:hypothetical protein